MTVLETTIEDGLMTVTLNRPDKLNALNNDLLEALTDALRRAEYDDVRCLLLSGAGDAFCAGGDIESMHERFGDVDPADQRSHMLHGPQRTIGDLYELDLPTVAKVDGAAVGAGMGIALACDLVIAAEGSTFGAPFANLGLMVDGGLSYLLPRLAGLRTATELVFTGEPFPAEEAAKMDLVNDVVPPDEIDDQCRHLTTKLAKGPTQAYKLSKDALRVGATHDMRSSLRNECKSQGIAISTADYHEGVEAFLEDREPEFTGE